MPVTETPIPKEPKLTSVLVVVLNPFIFKLPGRNVILPPILTSLTVEIPVRVLRFVASITGGKSTTPLTVKLPLIVASSATKRSLPTPRSLVIVDVPTTSRL